MIRYVLYVYRQGRYPLSEHLNGKARARRREDDLLSPLQIVFIGLFYFGGRGGNDHGPDRIVTGRVKKKQFWSRYQ
jgi:hypothetical protein